MAKINGVDLDDIIALEANIKKNFGSIAVFSLETEVSYRRTLKSFGDADFNKEGFKKIKNAYDKSMKRRGSDGDIPFRITEKERSKIRLCVLGNFKSVKYAKLVVLLNKKYELGVEL